MRSVEDVARSAGSFQGAPVWRKRRPAEQTASSASARGSLHFWALILNGERRRGTQASSASSSEEHRAPRADDAVRRSKPAEELAWKGPTERALVSGCSAEARSRLRCGRATFDGKSRQQCSRDRADRSSASLSRKLCLAQNSPTQLVDVPVRAIPSTAVRACALVNRALLPTDRPSRPTAVSRSSSSTLTKLTHESLNHHGAWRVKDQRQPSIQDSGVAELLGSTSCPPTRPRSRLGRIGYGPRRPEAIVGLAVRIQYIHHFDALRLKDACSRSNNRRQSCRSNTQQQQIKDA